MNDIGEVFCGDPKLLNKLFVPQDSHSSLIRESIIISKEQYENINNPILLTRDSMRPFLLYSRLAAKENTDDNPLEVR
tara:strand:- start:213 stop:446 length:234 start_codon:yes stop_codon:yes gene_type:complete